MNHATETGNQKRIGALLDLPLLVLVDDRFEKLTDDHIQKDIRTLQETLDTACNSQRIRQVAGKLAAQPGADPVGVLQVALRQYPAPVIREIELLCEGIKEPVTEAFVFRIGNDLLFKAELAIQRGKQLLELRGSAHSRGTISAFR